MSITSDSINRYNVLINMPNQTNLPIRYAREQITEAMKGDYYLAVGVASIDAKMIFISASSEEDLSTMINESLLETNGVKISVIYEGVNYRIRTAFTKLSGAYSDKSFDYSGLNRLLLKSP